MRLNNEDLLRLRNLKQEVLEVPSWGGKVIVRELSITEGMKYKEMMDSNCDLRQIIQYAVSCTMLEPTISPDEDLTNVSPSYINGLDFIFNNIQVIGKTKEQKEEFFKKENATFKASLENKPKLTKEEEEKK